MSAKRGNLDSIHKLAYGYYSGYIGIKRDFQKAIEYYYIAAELGDAKAKALIGIMLY
jgi:TPR repeat protein